MRRSNTAVRGLKSLTNSVALFGRCVVKLSLGPDSGNCFTSKKHLGNILRLDSFMNCLRFLSLSKTAVNCKFNLQLIVRSSPLRKKIYYLFSLKQITATKFTAMRARATVDCNVRAHDFAHTCNLIKLIYYLYQNHSETDYTTIYLPNFLFWSTVYYLFCRFSAQKAE